MSTRATEIEAELDTWPGIDTDSARFECCEFRLGVTEIGRLYGGARVEIRFDKRIRDALLESAVDVAIHPVYPNSGWVAYDLEGDESVDRTVALLRLAYLSQVAFLQRRGTADHELSLLDLERELDALDVPEGVLDAVRDVRSPERSDGDRRTSTSDRQTDASASSAESTAAAETTAETDDTDGEETRADNDERTPDDGIPSPT